VAPTTTVAPAPQSPLVRVVSADDTDKSIRDWFKANDLGSLYNHNKSALTLPPLGPGDVITVIGGVVVITPG
jgi:hypothetical protein